MSAGGYPKEAGTTTAEKGPLAEAKNLVKELEDLEDYYFGPDKGARVQKAFKSAVDCVDRVLAEPGNSRQQGLKSRAFYLKGRASSLAPGSEISAEELLSKAIKLDPQLVDAWNALGEVYWNMQDVAQAKQCFEQAIELCGPHPVSLRNLSMALRALDGPSPSGKAEDPAKAASRAQNYSKALEKAKEAVALGPSDPQNWETLGNAYVGNFFVNARRPDEIKRALIAYEKGDSIYEKLGKRNPTLHFNRGMAAKYMEDYDLALRSFSTAHEIGASGAAEQGRQVWDLVEKLADQTEKKCELKVKRLKELVADFPGSEVCRTLKELQAGDRSSVPLVVKVVSVLERPGEVPVIVICCDSSGDFFALSFYNAELQKLGQAVVPMKTLLSVSQASFRQVTVSGPGGKKLSYSSVAVANPADAVILSGGSAGSTGSSLALATGRSMVYSTGAENRSAENEVAAGSGKSSAEEPVGKTLSDCQQHLIKAAREAAARGEGRAAIIRALMPQLRSLIDVEFGTGSGSRLVRVEEMFQRMGRGDIFEEEDEKEGKRYAPGYVAGLEPTKAFHEVQGLPWVSELRKHAGEIQSELRKRIEQDPHVWVPGAYAVSNTKYGPEWKIAGVLTADKWEDQGIFPVTQRILKRLKGITPFEAFFARMPAHTTIAAHSDNLNYVLTSHLALELEAGMCSIRVGNHEQDWEEGEVMVFDTSFIHSAYNDSERNRYVLVLRFWHPSLTTEERRAIHLSHTLLAGTPDPEKMKAGQEVAGAGIPSLYESS